MTKDVSIKVIISICSQNKDLENYYDKLSLAPLPIIRLFPDMKNDKFYLSMLKDQYF
jgi:hypothetical protein